MSEAPCEADNEAPHEKISEIWVKVEVVEEETQEIRDSDHEEQQPVSGSPDRPMSVHGKIHSDVAAVQFYKDIMNVVRKHSRVKIEVEVDHMAMMGTGDEDGDEETRPQQARDYEGSDKRIRPKKKRTAVHRNHLKCDYCDYRTSFKNALKYHVMNHTNPTPLACDQCSYTTKYPNSLQRHILGHQIKDNPDLETPQFKCDECDYVSIFKFNLKAHKRKHAKVKRFKCDLCDFGTSYQQSFLKHQRSHQRRMLKESGSYVKEPKQNKLPSVTYQCDKCSFVTKFEGHIARHLAQIHKEVSAKANRCDHCDFATKLKWRLNIHVNRSRQPSPTKCEYCDFVTEYNCAYKQHKRLQHLGHVAKLQENSAIIREDTTSVAMPEPQPPVIDKTQFLLDKDNVEIDWRSIEVLEKPWQEKSFQCTQCDYTAKFKASVQRHFQRHHTSNDKRPYKCLNCDFSTKTRDQISLHAKRSQSNMLLRCNKCEFSTYFKCQLIMHQKCHYPFKCALCNYTCKLNYDIQRHFSAVHLGNAMKCRYCDFKSARKESLLNHETTHTGVKPFQCGQCDYSAIRRSLLLNHIKKNHYDASMEPVIYDDSKIESLKNADERFMNSFQGSMENVKEFRQRIDSLFGQINSNILNATGVGSTDGTDSNRHFDLERDVGSYEKCLPVDNDSETSNT